MPSVSLVAWISFVGFVIAMLAVDLGLFQRRGHVMGMKEALVWFGVWLGLAMVFNVGLAFFHPRGVEAGVEFFTGYLVEKSLSVDTSSCSCSSLGSSRFPELSKQKSYCGAFSSKIDSQQVLNF